MMNQLQLLDPELRQEVEKLILQNREIGITQIVITHDMQFAQHIADEIVTINPKIARIFYEK